MKIKKYSLLLLVLLTSCNSNVSLTLVPEFKITDTPVAVGTPTGQNNSPNYIELTYPPLPIDVLKGPSMSIYSSNPSDKWGISIIFDGQSFMLWFERLIYRDQNGEPHWQVNDTLFLPSPVENQVVIVDQCFINGVLDNEIVVLGGIDEEVFSTRHLPSSNVVLSWRANRATGKLDEIERTNVECTVETVLEYPWKMP